MSSNSSAGTSWFLSDVSVCPQSIIRVVFHDRRLQYTEHQQLEGWRWNRPGDRILDLGELSASVWEGYWTTLGEEGLKGLFLRLWNWNCFK